MGRQFGTNSQCATDGSKDTKAGGIMLGLDTSFFFNFSFLPCVFIVFSSSISFHAEEFWDRGFDAGRLQQQTTFILCSQKIAIMRFSIAKGQEGGRCTKGILVYDSCLLYE